MLLFGVNTQLELKDPTDLGDVLNKVFSERQPAADEPHGDHMMG